MYVQSTSRPIKAITHVRLFLAAMVLSDSKGTRIDLKEDDCEGRVTTAWESSSIGGIAGTLFEGELDAEEGSVHVTFVCREIDLETSAALAKQGIPLIDLFPYLDDEEAVAIDQRQWN